APCPGGRARGEPPRPQNDRLRAGTPPAAGLLPAGCARRHPRLRRRSARQRLQARRRPRGPPRPRLPLLRLGHQEADPLRARESRPDLQGRGHLARSRGEGPGLPHRSHELQRLPRRLERVLPHLAHPRPDPPPRTTTGTTGVLVPGTLAEIDLIATMPQAPGRVIKSDGPRPLAAYSEAIVVGDLVFAAGQLASDFKTGVPREARVDPAFP